MQPQQITQLLSEYGKGDELALAKLLPQVYEHLHRLAKAYMRKENPNHTLQATALVNEAFLRLTSGQEVSWQNRAHFFAVSAQMMRRILIDHAKAKRAAKRGGGGLRISFDEKVHHQKETEGPDLMALDEALIKLAEVDERQAKLVELRYFGGLSIEETAEVMKISPATVKRDWATAKLWLYRELKNEEDDTKR